jgi:hypothetical protein
VISFTLSATKHRITDEQIQHVIDHCGLPFVIEAPASNPGPDRLLFLGDDARGVALEVVAIELPEDELLVLHAQRMRSRHLPLYLKALECRVMPPPTSPPDTLP